MCYALLSSIWLPALFILLPIMYTQYVKYKKNQQKQDNLPPRPPRLPILGNLHQLGKLPYRSLRALSDKYGPIMLLQLGSIPTVVVSSAETAKDVLKTNDLDCCTRPRSPGPERISYNYLDIIFSPYSDYWKEMRSLVIHELLSMKRVRSFGQAREAEVDKLVSLLSKTSGKQINLNEHIYNAVDGLIGTIAFGKIYGAEQFSKQSFQRVLDDTINMMSSFAAQDFFPSSMGRMVDVLTGFHAKLEKIFKNLDRFLERVLDAHLDPARPKPESEDIVDIMIGLWKDQRSQFSLTKDHMKAILMDVFIGATNTTSVTILWAMAELVKQPKIMKKVQHEIRSIVGKKPRVDGDDIGKLKYLKMIVKETFRMHPPAPLLVPRETMRHCKLGGYDIPPQTRVFVNAWAIGRDAKTWTNPDEFYPERFEDIEIDFKGQNLELLPFGAGRRICPGLLMGTTNVEFILANLLYSFDWELPSGMQGQEISMEEEGKLVFHRKEPLCVVPVLFNQK